MTDDRRVEDLGAERRALLALLLEDEHEPSPVSRAAPLPLSFAQERMWVSEQVAAAATGVSVSTYHLRGALDRERLERALEHVARRHEILRTRFVDRAGPVQVVDPPGPWSVRELDLSSVDDVERRRRLDEHVEAELRTPRDLARDRLLTVSAVTLAPDRHVLVAAAHHMVVDGWSVGLLFAEVGEVYAALADGRAPALPALPIQYADYAVWQRRRAEEPAVKGQLAYWKARLAAPLPALELPTDRPRSETRRFAGRTCSFALSAEVCRAVEELGRSVGATPFMVLLAGFKALLQRCTGQTDLLVGTPVAGRAHRRTEALVGCFMQPLVVRTDLGGEPSFRELVARVRSRCLEAYGHQDVPFELVARALHPRWDGAHVPLFQVLFNVQREKLLGARFADLRVERSELFGSTAGLELSVHLWLGEGGARGAVEYSSELFDAETVSWLMERYADLLAAATEAPDRPLSALELSSPGIAVPRGARSAEREELLRLLVADDASVVEPASASDEPSPEPMLSFGQERLWLVDRLGGDLIQTQAMHLVGPLDAEALRRAADAIVERHAVLRTAVDERDGRPVARILPACAARFATHDLAGLDERERERRWRELARAEGARPFELSDPPLFRLTLVRLGPRAHVLLLAAHHIVADGWSLGLFRDELRQLYRAFARGEPSPLARLPLQYADYAAWQRRAYREALVAGELAYWMRKLQGPLPELQLPVDRLRAAGRLAVGRKRRRSFELAPDLVAALGELGAREGTTLFMTLFGAFTALLLRYGNEDVVVDTPIAGRERREHAGLIGFFVNSLLLRVDASGGPTFAELLACVRATCLEAYAHQGLPIDRVVARLRPDARGRPLTPVSFMLHEALTSELELGEGLRLIPEEPELNDEHELTLVLWRGADRLTGEVQYDAERLAPETIERFVGHWTKLLAHLVAAPERRIAEHDYLGADELSELASWNATARERPAVCVHELFAAQAARAPEAVAVRLPGRAGGADEELTYGELDQRANRLAQRLSALGAGPEVRVGLCAERSLELLVGVLGILKSGAAYVPLDPSYPEERLDFMVQDAGLALVVTQAALASSRPSFAGCTAVLLDDAPRLDEPADAPASGVTPQNAAYVIYTSGSTGRPKGVVVEHRSVVNHNLAVVEAFELTAEDRVLQFHSLAFDAAVEEIFPTWAAGATLVVRGEELIAPGRELARWIAAERLTVVDLPTAYWHEWVLALEREPDADALVPAPLRLVIVGGDAVSPRRLQAWRARCDGRVRWLDTYGPTEGTIIATIADPADAGEGDDDAPTIGRPIANVTVHVLDQELRPVPVGAAGELCLGGVGLARGYLGDPELTAARFVRDPFTEDPLGSDRGASDPHASDGARLYRTGDRARRRADGRIEFLGRFDGQLKLRGFRVEPGEIEAALETHPDVAQAVVRAWPATEGEDRRLVAYVVPRGAPPATSPAALDEGALAVFLRARLPGYLVPSAFVVLAGLPTTPTGKLDRAALPEPERAAPGGGASAPPRTPFEAELARIWSDVLRVPTVGIHDNFFELGGDSLLVMRVVSRAGARGLEVATGQLFLTPTIAELADAVDGATEWTAVATARGIERVAREGPLPLSFVQERVWVTSRMAGSGGGVTGSAARIVGPLEPDAFQRACAEIVRRHDVLRTSFDVVAGVPVQVVAPAVPAPVTVVDLSHLAPNEAESEALRLARDVLRRPLDLARGPLVSIELYRLAEALHVVTFAVHHVAFDGWSGDVVARELAALYDAFRHGRPSPLAELPIQYRDYAAWQRAKAGTAQHAKHLAFWVEELRELPALELPFDRPRAERRTARGAAHAFRLPSGLVPALERVAHDEEATLFMALLAAFKATLHGITAQEVLVVGTPVANRGRVELEPLVGCFMQPLVLRTELAGDSTPREVVRRVRDTCRRAFAHQDVAFEEVARALRPEWSSGRIPLFQVLFDLEWRDPKLARLADLAVTPLDTGRAFSPLDLSVHLVVVGEEVHGVLEYSPELFDAETMAWLELRFQRVLESLAHEPAQPLSTLVFPRPAAHAEADLGALAPERRELLALLLREGDGAGARSRTGSNGAGSNGTGHHGATTSPHTAPLSFGQERLWFLEQLDPSRAAFNEAQTAYVDGPLDVVALQRAWTEVVRRHAILRTGFVAERGRPVQVIAAEVPTAILTLDHSGLPAELRAASVRELAEGLAREPFDLSRPPLVRLLLVRHAEDAHVLLVTTHHLVADGRSASIVRHEVGTLYHAFVQGRPSPLAELPVQYADFAREERERCRGVWLHEAEAYWRRRLAGPLPPLELCARGPRDGGPSAAPAGPRRHAQESFEIPAATRTALVGIARETGATPFMVLLAAYAALLHRATGATDLVIDAPVHGRTRRELEPLIGFFVNSLALRIDLSGDPSFPELVRRVRATCLEAYEHQELPYDRVVALARSGASAAGGARALASVGFMLHPALTGAETWGGLTVRPEAAELSDELDLTLVVWEGRDAWTASFGYDPSRLERALLRRWVASYATLLERVTRDAGASLAEHVRLTEKELSELASWNATARERPAVCVHELFAAQAAGAPEAVAVRLPGRAGGADEELTYGELDQRANRLAQRLSALGAGPEVRVGLCAERSLELLVGVLGILKSGAAYVPLDPSYPEERLDFMVQDAGLALVVTQAALASSRPSFAGCTAVLLDDAPRLDEPADAPASGVTPQNAAYVIYTSGSTGRPKGVVVEHRSVVNHNLAVVEAFELTAEDRVLQFHSLAFDAAVEEIFPTWAAGATLVVRGREPIAPGRELARWIAAERLTVVNLPTAYWHEWVLALEREPLSRPLAQEPLAHWPLAHWREPEADALVPAPLRLVIVGGDAVSPRRLQAWRARCDGRVRWLDTYGPTEGTIIATIDDPAQAGDDDPPAIGRPIANVAVHVLDRELRPVPVGAAGELCLAGLGVARGYLGDPELTAERFVRDPFREDPGARLYRTGDRARRRADGRIEFLGRLDGQLKLRGFRVEPGEIEAALERHPDVAQAAVRAWPATEGEDRRLVAYVVPRGAPSATSPIALDEGALALFLRARLPGYLVPSAFVVLAGLPTTPTGKLDRAALPQPGAHARRGFVAPATPSEVLTAEVWAEVLGVERVGLEDDFFELGGHSLKASEVVYRVREAFGVELPLTTLFEAPTVADFARRVDARLGGSARGARELPPIGSLPREGDAPLSYAQEGAWFFDQLQPGVSFSIPLVARVAGALDVDAFAKALAAVVARHDVLRTTFVASAGIPRQVVLDALPVPVPVVDLTHTAEPARAAWVWIVDEARRSFDLARGPLLFAAVLRLGPMDQVVFVNVHHAVFDGTSVGLFARELATHYHAERTGTTVSLPAPAVQYADYAVWQRHVLQGDTLATELAYWKQQLADAPVGLDLGPDPGDGRARATEPLEGGLALRALSPRLSEALRALARRENVTLFMLLLAAFKLLLMRVSGQTDLVVGTPVATRGQAELKDAIGFFVNVLALRTDLSGDPTFRELVRRVRETCLAGYRHRELPFGLLVQHLHPERAANGAPIVSVQFALQPAAGGVLALPGLELRPLLDVAGPGGKAFGGVGLPEELRELAARVGPATEHLFLQLVETDGGLTALLQHRADLFDRSGAERLLERFERLLEAVVDVPDARIGDAPILSEAERARLLGPLADGGTRPLAYTRVHHGFEARATAAPDALAARVAGTDDELTYGELERAANRLAQRLMRLGIRPGDRVGLACGRSTAMPVGLLGILKAGAAYVPLDPTLPAERLAFLIEDAQLAGLVTEAALADRFPATLATVRLDGDELARESDARPSPPLAPDDPAYLIYTSGTTGQPKAVVVPHRAVANHNLAVRERFGLTPTDRVLQFHSISFDAAVEELFPTWSAGGAVVLRAEPVAPGRELERLIEREAITVVNLPTAYWHEWVTAAEHERAASPANAVLLPSSLRLVIVGGDAVSAPLVTRWRALAGDGVRWINTYGPTEAAIVCTLDEPLAGAQPTIGRPIPNTRAYVLDPEGRPVPLGAAGELCVGGMCVALGYHRRPELTAERFVPDPFAGGGRLYRTGDRVRFLSDGRLQFLGRVDEQVKVRGFRVEPAEVEHALRAHPDVRDAHVLAVGERIEDKRLVAYAVLREDGAAEPEALRAFLAERVPGYLVPSAVLVLDAFPRTSGGKVDRRALPVPPGLRPVLERPYVAPRTPSEVELARLWTEILDVDRVGVHDDFFTLGGHSLLAARFVARVNTELSIELPLLALFERPTVAGLAPAIDALVAGELAAERETLDLAREVVLDDDIAPPGASGAPGAGVPSGSPGVPARAAADPQHVFLTGAAGFLGSFLLQRLLETTRAKVHCLVRRSESVEAGALRLRQALESFALWDDAYAGRIVPVLGDLSLPCLGLSTDAFEELARTIDVVYHNGARVNLLHPYATLKPANVGGTHEVLRLACTARAKPVHYVSTVSVLDPNEHTGGVLVERLNPGSGAGLLGGYAQTKWVAERLVELAGERGLPVTIYRPGRITGDTRNGRFGRDPLLLNGLRTLLALEALPRIEGAVVDLVPVDYVAAAIVALSRRADAKGRAFHLVNPEPAPWNELIERLRGFGYPLRELDPESWARALLAFARRTPASLLHPMLPFVPAAVIEALEGRGSGASEATSATPSEDAAAGYLCVGCDEALETLRGTGVSCPPALELLDVYLPAFWDSGDLERPLE